MLGNPSATQEHYFTRNHEGQPTTRERPFFFMEPVIDELASAQEGRTIARDVECIRIATPGNTLTIFAGRVTDEHRYKWPAEYAAFKEGREIEMSGTPIEMWGMLRPSQVTEWKAMGVRSVENMADLNDHDIQRLGMGARNMRDAARAFLDNAEATKLQAKLAADNERKDNQIAALTHQVEELGHMLNQINARVVAAADAPNPLASIPQYQLNAQAPPETRDLPQSSLNDFVHVERTKRGPGRPRKEEAA